MYSRRPEISSNMINKIHQASLRILEGTGVAFNDEQAIELFKKNGFKVEGTTVFFQEQDVKNALETAPETFEIHARNPEHNLTIGGDDFVFLPAYGAPFIAEVDGRQRAGTMEDYNNFCKLVQTSTEIGMNAYLMIDPEDVAAKTQGLDMVLSNLLLCDKAFMGCQTDRRIAEDLIEMLAIAFCNRDKEKVKEKCYTVSLINVLTPLQFSDEMAGALMALSANGQAVIIANMVIGGTSGPVTLSGILSLINAEVLSGIVLTQLVNPGAPVIYGSTSTATNFKTGAAAVGVPEQAALISATAQMAKFYNLPCRSGGALCDAHTPDSQAGYEGSMQLQTAVNSGVNFILHSCGQMGGHISISYEKFLMDEEFCGMLRRLTRPLNIQEDELELELELEIKAIEEAGIGGQFLTQARTFQLCRSEYFQTNLFCHDSHDAWNKKGGLSLAQNSSAALEKRLANYQVPEMDPEIKQALETYVETRKSE
ncbi:MAG: trimethylamine methyltransferase family protein [Desulfobacterales bacterium]|nr:trimethylamine methyltransferase family protein [Desulfobacterales bacterium]